MPKKILIIDDNQDILKILVLKLELKGYQVATAKDAISGLIKVKSERPDLILLDIMMPVTDGFEALKRIKGSPETADTPTIMLTAKRQRDDVLRAMELGAVDYIVKPIDFAKLLDKVKKNIRQDSPDQRQVEILSSSVPTPAPVQAAMDATEAPDLAVALASSATAAEEARTTITAGDFTLRTWSRRSVAVLEMEGDLDEAAVERTIREVTDITEFDTKKIVVDVSALRNFFWFKIDNLLKILKFVEDRGGQVRIVCRDQGNYQTLIRSRVRFSIVRDVPEAFQMFGEAEP